MKTKQYDAVSLGTGVMPILSVNTYGTVLDMGEVLENDMYELQRNGLTKLVEKFWDNSSFDLYKKNVLMPAVEEAFVPIERDLKGLSIGIRGVNLIEISSPSYYNFSGDELEFELIVSEDFLDLLAKALRRENQEEFASHIKEEFTSRDGFMSLTSNNVEEFYLKIAEGHAQEVGFAIYWLLRENRDDYQESLEEALYQFNDPVAVLEDEALIDEINNAFASID